VSYRALLLVSVLGSCVPFCFVRPFFGVLVWTILSFACPQAYCWGARYYFPSAELVAVPTILGFIVFNHDWKRLWSRESLFIVLLWAWFTVTSIVAAGTPLFANHIDDMWDRYAFVSKVLLMTFLTMGAVNSFARLRTLVIVTASCFTFYVVKALPWLVASGGNFRLYGPPRSMVADNNDLGLALNMTLPLMFFLFQTERNPKLRRLFLWLVGCLVLGIFCTYSRGALVGLVVVAGLMIMQLRQRIVLIPMLALVVLVAALFAPEKWKDRMDLAQKNRTLDASAYSRINAWTFSWNLVQDYPITGGGFETFEKELFDRYAPTSKDVHGPHSIYFGVLGEHGFVGLGLYLTLVASCFLSTRKIIKASKLYGDEVATGYALMCRYSLIGFLTCGLFLGRAYFDYWFAIVAFIVILKKVSFEAWANQTLVTGEPFEVTETLAEVEYAG
jgi:probable O-glycosylation ligase (exosortase A-associated)